MDHVTGTIIRYLTPGSFVLEIEEQAVAEGRTYPSPVTVVLAHVRSSRTHGISTAALLARSVEGRRVTVLAKGMRDGHLVAAEVQSRATGDE